MDANARSTRATRKLNNGKLDIVDNASALDLVELAMSGHCHLVQKGLQDTMREIRVARILCQKPGLFMRFPISLVLAPRFVGQEMEDRLTLEEWSLSNHGDKTKVLEGISELFNGSRLNSILRDDLLLTADEFCCNVLFNANKENGVNKETLANTVDSAKRNTLSHPGILRVGAYKGYLAISCWDGFGSLDPQRLLGRLLSCLREGAGSALNQSEFGTAGIGSFLVFNACTSLYMAVEKGVGTQFCALFPLHARARERNTRPKHLHWLQY